MACKSKKKSCLFRAVNLKKVIAKKEKETQNPFPFNCQFMKVITYSLLLNVIKVRE